MTTEAKAIMTAKRMATIAAKKAKSVITHVVDSLLDVQGVTAKHAEAKHAEAKHAEAKYTETGHTETHDTETQYAETQYTEVERRQVFPLLIDMGDLFPSHGISWLTTQLNLPLAKARMYAEEFSRNKDALVRKYQPKDIDVTDLTDLMSRLNSFYKAKPEAASFSAIGIKQTQC
jgi:hypothetical protein